MKHLGVVLVLGLGVVAASSGQAQQANTASIASAYQGAVGDWALGRWKGNAYDRGGSRTSLNNIAFGFVIEKQEDGKVLCRSFGSAEQTPVIWAPKCEIDAKAIKITTPKGDILALGRAGEKLEGTATSHDPKLRPLFAEAMRN